MPNSHGLTTSSCFIEELSPSDDEQSRRSDPSPTHGNPAHAEREVRYSHSSNFAGILREMQFSLLVSTYQAGKLVALGASPTGLNVSFHNFDRAMGLALAPERLAVGTTSQIWMLRRSAELIPGLGPSGSYDCCLLTRSSWFTSNIQAHEMAWCGDELWVVNTLFSCLCTPDEQFSFAPRWYPPFITALAPEDRCHLNGLAMANGQPKYVTALAETNTARGWRSNKAHSGCVIEIDSGQTVARGFAMPHSPRVHDGQLYVLNSGTGRLVHVDTTSGRMETVVSLPGYARGLAIHGSFAFVALSKIRETSTFGGVPIAEQRDQLKCGLAVVDLTAARTVASFEFQSGVDELFDVQVIAGVKCPAISGPYAHLENGDVWAVRRSTPPSMKCDP
jgi:uncharacterized protein (TIGR03032 family)